MSIYGATPKLPYGVDCDCGKAIKQNPYGLWIHVDTGSWVCFPRSAYVFEKDLQ